MLQNFFLRHFQYNQEARRFFLTIVALGFVIDGVYAVLLNLYMLRLGYDTRVIGQINSVGLLTFAMMSLPAGLFGTWWTSSRMLKIGLASILLGTILLPFAEFISTSAQELWLMMTYALTLAGFSLYFVNGTPFLMAAVGKEKQNSAFAMQTALLAFAAFVGSLFAGNLPSLIAYFQDFSLDDPEPYRYTLMLTAIVVLVAFIITLTITNPSEEIDPKNDFPDLINFPKRKNSSIAKTTITLIVVMSLVRFLQVAGLGTASVFFNVYMDTELAISPNIIGIVAAVARIIIVPTVLLAPRLIDRSSNATVALWASLATAICLLPIAFVPMGWAASLGYIGAIAVTNLRFTAFIVYIMVLVPKHRQALMAGAGEMAAGFSFAFMAFTGGYIVDLFGFRELFLLGAILTGLGTLIFGLHLRHRH